MGYHLAALVYSKKLWAPFRTQISSELTRFLRAGREPDLSHVHLVVVGVSGGYCLEPSFLKSFAGVTAVDIDPFAGLVFQQRLRDGARFIRQDFFSALEEAEWSLEHWMARYAAVSAGASESTVFLFSNILGQLGYLYSDLRLKEVSEGLSRAFGSKALGWMSFHDRISLPGKLRDSVIRSEERYPSEKLVREFLISPAGVGAPVEAEEHVLGEWVQAGRGGFVYLSWRLTSARTQIIEICGAV